MKKTKSKKIKNKSNKKNQDLGQTKNSAKLVLFLFGELLRSKKVMQNILLVIFVVNLNHMDFLHLNL